MARSSDNFITLFTQSGFHNQSSCNSVRPPSPDLDVSETTLKYSLSLNSPDYNSYSYYEQS